MPDINREYAEPKLDWRIEKPGEHWTFEHESGNKLSVKLAVAGYTLTVETGDGPPVEHSIGSMAAHFLGAAERLYERYQAASATGRPTVGVQPEPSSKPAPTVEVQPAPSSNPAPSVEVQPEPGSKPAPSVEVQPEPGSKPAPIVEVQPDSESKPTRPADRSTEKAEPSPEPFIIVSDGPRAEGSGA